MASINVNSLTARRDIVAAETGVHGLAVIACQESRLSSDVEDMEINIPNYCLMRRDVTRNRGGVCVYAANALQPTTAEHKGLKMPHNCQAVSIRPRRGAVIVLINVYRTPSQTRDQREAWENALIVAIGRLTMSTPAVMCGDLNLSPEEPGEAGLFEALRCLGFADANTGKQLTHRKRRIDHIWLRGVEGSGFTIGAPLERGDGHGALRIQLTLPGAVDFACWERRGGGRQWSRGDWAQARTIAATTLAVDPTLPTAATTSEVITQLTNSLNDIFSATVPHSREIYVRPWAPEWMNRGILTHSEAVKRTRREWKNAQETGDEHRISAARIAYTRARSKRGANLRCTISLYSKSIAGKAYEARRPWDAVKQLTGIRHRIAPFPTTAEGTTVWAISALDKARALSASFRGNFTEPALALYQLPPAPEAPDPAHLLTPYEATCILRTLPPSKAPGLDQVSPRALKELAVQLGPALARLINRVITEGRIPDQWRSGVVVPVEKTSSPTAPGHYRPIVLPDAFTRAFEQHLIKLLKPFLGTESRQFAFHPGSSSQDAILRFLHDIVDLNENSGPGPVRVACVLLDAAKAYDALPVSTIVQTLLARGAPPGLTLLIKDWLSERRLHVRVEGTCAEPFTVHSGVPQGSSLAPQLFTMAVDEILAIQLPPGVRLTLFADDLAIVGAMRSRSEWMDLQESVHRAEAALNRMGLRLNPQKSAWMCVHFGGPPRPAYRLHLGDGSEVPYDPSPTYLGVKLDETLSFNAHWNQQAGQIKGLAGALGRSLRGQRGLLRMTFKSMLEGKLNYALPFAPPRAQSAMNSLRMAMSFAGRTLLNEWTKLPLADGTPGPIYVENADQVLRRANLANPETLARDQSLRYTYKCLYGRRQYGRWIEQDHGHRREGPNTRAQASLTSAPFPTHLVVPPCRVARFRHLQPLALPTTWNALRWTEVDLDKTFRNLGRFTAAIPELTGADPPDDAPNAQAAQRPTGT